MIEMNNLDFLDTDDGGRNDFEIKIAEAEFVSRKNDYTTEGITGLRLAGKDEDGDEHEAFFSCGKGWEPSNSGRSIEYPGKPKKRVHGKSLYGMLSHAARMKKGAKEDSLIGLGLSEELLRRYQALGDPSHRADVWKGLTLKFKGVTFNYGDRKEILPNGEIETKPITSIKSFPVEVMSIGESGPESFLSIAKRLKAVTGSYADWKRAMLTDQAIAKNYINEMAEMESGETGLYASI